MRRAGPLLLLLGASVLVARGEEPATFRDTVVPFLEEHCTGCHSGRRPKAELDLAAASVRDAEGIWRKVRRKLVRGEMPPADSEPPPAADVRAVVAWIDAAFGTGRAPREGLRRLNRVEYENTIRDLLGVDFDASASFPADDVGYGFDNIGDVLSLPPALLEKYVAAAEEIAAQAILVEPAAPPARRIAGADLHISGYGRHTPSGAAFLYANGEVTAEIQCPRAGEYLVRAHAYGQQAGPEAVRIAFRADGHPFGTAIVPEVESAPGTYEARAKVDAGTHRFGVAFVNDYYRPKDPDPQNRDRNFGVLWLEIVGPVDAPVYPESHRRLIPRDAPAAGWEPYLKEIVGRLGARAWRRPLTGAEIGRLLRAVERAAPDAAPFAKRVQLALTALLVSPHFLFHVPRKDEYGLAERLSYFLWSSPPDDELFALAAAGLLRDQLEAQVGRMLKDARASALSRNFASQWLKVRALEEVSPDPERFPGVDDALKAAMRAETELYFEAILREGRSVWELLDSDFTFANGPLARHYGLPGVRGDRMRRVRLDGRRRGGVLTHASVLTLTSNPTRTSPVKRGKWILETLLDDPPPPPPPGVGNLAEATEALSPRERLARHRTDPNCASCHTVMDSLGLGLEHYDAVGRWRDRDGDRAIDDTATLPDGRRFAGAAGLRRMLRADRRFLRSLAKHMLVYARGRGVTEHDDPALRALVATLEKEPTLPALVREVARLLAKEQR